MRLWSVHPSYLDSRGLVALWREGLLAQEILLGNTQGYKNHPQLVRFRETANPLGAIASYLRYVADEADGRGYGFDRRKIINRRIHRKIIVTSGQLEYEFCHLLGKLKRRGMKRYQKLKGTKRIRTHPLLHKVRGGIEDWEVV